MVVYSNENGDNIGQHTNSERATKVGGGMNIFSCNKLLLPPTNLAARSEMPLHYTC